MELTTIIIIALLIVQILTLMNYFILRKQIKIEERRRQINISTIKTIILSKLQMTEKEFDNLISDMENYID